MCTWLIIARVSQIFCQSMHVKLARDLYRVSYSSTNKSPCHSSSRSSEQLEVWINGSVQELQIASWLYIECMLASWEQANFLKFLVCSLSLWLKGLFLLAGGSLSTKFHDKLSGLRNLNEFTDGSRNTRVSNFEDQPHAQEPMTVCL